MQKPLFVFLLFLYILSRIGLLLYVFYLVQQMYLQEPIHCTAEILVRLNTELTKTKENLFEGKVKVKIFFFQIETPNSKVLSVTQWQFR